MHLIFNKVQKFELTNDLTAQTMLKITLVHFDSQPYKISYQKFNNNQVRGVFEKVLTMN